jgi:hypothetical protein
MLRCKEVLLLLRGFLFVCLFVCFFVHVRYVLLTWFRSDAKELKNPT